MGTRNISPSPRGRRNLKIKLQRHYRSLPITTTQAMLIAMKNSILVALIILSFSSHAGLYKGLDDEGNVVYSDTPFKNAEVITPPAITIVDAPKIKPKPVAAAADSEEKVTETKYTHFNISSPKNDQTIWNEDQLTVVLQLKPALDTESGHSTWLIMDGKPLVKKSRSLSLLIGRADRGTHTLQAQIRNKKGKIIKRTKSIQVHIKNTVIPRKSPR